MYSVSHIFVSSRAGPFILYIILTNFEDEDDTLPAVLAPLLPDYTPDSNSDSKLTKDDSSNEDLIVTDEPLQAQTALTPFVQPPPTRLLPTISAFVLRPGQEIPLRCL
ncbi:hypothetical protein Tco_0917428 [Tanacetum coccineum]